MFDFFKLVKGFSSSVDWDIVFKIIIVILVIILIVKGFSSSVDWDIVLSIFIAILAWYLSERSNRYWEKWKLKKEACLQALDIADAILSNLTYEKYVGKIDKQNVTIEETRKCFNLLECSCDNIEVIKVLKKIVGSSVSPDIIVDLRNAVRKELDFGNIVFDEDREKAFIARLPINNK